MKRMHTAVVAGLVSWLLPALLAAQPPAVEIIPAPAPREIPTELTSAPLSPEERAQEIARLRYLLYQRVEYPLRLRQLDSEIRIASAELKSLDRQIQEYESISRPVASHPFLFTLESAKMRRVAVQERLQFVQHEKRLVLQSFQIERRLRQLEAQ